MSLQNTEPPFEDSQPVNAIPQNRWLLFGFKLRAAKRRWVTRRNLAVLSVVSAFAVLLVLFVSHFAHLVFTKPKQVDEGGLAHRLLISKFVREMPAFKPLENSARYYFNLINNKGIPAYIMRYESNAPPEEIISYYRLYFEILNYSHIRHRFDSKAIAMFRNTREGFTVFVSVGEGVNTVSIENFKFK